MGKYKKIASLLLFLAMATLASGQNDSSQTTQSDKPIGRISISVGVGDAFDMEDFFADFGNDNITNGPNIPELGGAINYQIDTRFTVGAAAGY